MRFYEDFVEKIFWRLNENFLIISYKFGFDFFFFFVFVSPLKMDTLSRSRSTLIFNHVFSFALFFSLEDPLYNI